ncbi:MAG TPA: hypothetical protein VMU93_12550 [Caulobacteraceae bacterium]|nr:hypothetical protein [Caulobacteraceae bacterium]
MNSARGCSLAARWAGGLGAALMAGVLLHAPGAAADTRLTPALPLDGASLGMSAEAWKQLPPPASAGATATPACWTNPRAVRIPGYPLSAADRRSGVAICAWVDRFGHDVLPHSIRLEGPFRASDLRFVFVRDRLARVEFRTSVDAYSDVTALLDQRYGRPVLTTRGRVRSEVGPLRRVRRVWRTPSGEVVLTDPSADRVDLSVTMRRAGSGVS